MGTSKRSIVCAVLLISVAVLFAGCRKGVPVSMPTSPMPAVGKMQDKDIAAAIIRAGAMTNWEIIPLKPGLMDGRLAVRGKHSITVEIIYNDKEYSIHYKNSTNMEYQNGVIHPNYNKWVATLDMNIRRELADFSRR